MGSPLVDALLRAWSIPVVRLLSSAADKDFLEGFRAGKVQLEEFEHRAHIRLAYILLCDHDDDEAHQSMRRALLSFLERHGIDSSKYHETMTRAWILAVRHFMEKTPASIPGRSATGGRRESL